jgi:hypothetical protein
MNWDGSEAFHRLFELKNDGASLPLLS